MVLKAVFLDAGGTLIHEHPARAEIYATAARSAGIDIDAEGMRVLMQHAFAALPRTIGAAYRYSERWFAAFIERIFGAELGLEPAAVERARRELVLHFADPATFRLFPGAAELCARVRAAGLRLGVISNWSEPLPRILAGLGLSPPVEFVLVSAIERCEKPEREIFARALARAAVNASDALHAGNDPELDCRGAGAAGLRAVLVDRAGAWRDAPCPRVASLEELGRLILEEAR